MRKIILLSLIFIISLNYVYARYCTGNTCTSDLVISLTPIDADIVTDDNNYPLLVRGQYLFTLALDAGNATNPYNGAPSQAMGTYTYYWNDNWFSNYNNNPSRYYPLKIAYCDWKDMQYITPTVITTFNKQMRLDYEPNMNEYDWFTQYGYFPKNYEVYLEDEEFKWVNSLRSINMESLGAVDTICTNTEQKFDITCGIYINPEYTSMLKEKGYNEKIGVGDIFDKLYMGNNSQSACKNWSTSNDARTQTCFFKFQYNFNVGNVHQKYNITAPLCRQYKLVPPDSANILPPIENTTSFDVDDINETNEDPSGGDDETGDNYGEGFNSTGKYGPGDGDISISNIEDAIDSQIEINNKIDILTSIFNVIKLIFSMYLFAFIIFQFWIMGYFFGKLLISIPSKVIDITKKAGRGL